VLIYRILSRLPDQDGPTRWQPPLDALRPHPIATSAAVPTHLETWLELASTKDGESPPAPVERTFRRYLECGILAHGFARAYCDECQHDFPIAYACKCRGVCPSCPTGISFGHNTRRMAETGAHLVDHVFPPLPVRQWVLAVPKRLRYFLQRDTALQGTMLRIFLSVVERCLREQCPGCPADARIGAVAFIHRFGSSLNEHIHFHCCVIDGVFEPAVAPDDAPSVIFHAALAHALDAAAFADVQARVRTRVLRAFVKRGLIDKDDAAEMRAWAHDGGFSVDGSVRIEDTDRTGLERLLRYCARPPFALEHLHQRDAEHLVTRNPKPVRTTAPGARPAALVLMPLELITKIAAVVPPPRAHRHRYDGVLAPNAPLRSVVTALAPAAVPPAPTSVATSEEPRHRAVARYLWAILLARLYEAFPLLCPICHGQMRIIAFVNDAGTVKKILDHIGESTQPPRISPARGPPLWEAAAAAEQAENDPQWDSLAQSAPEMEFDQRIAW
jgi:hypothetical protein